MKKYDAIIVGAGQAGGPLASALAADGMTTAIIERTHIGGTCVNNGCTPTKTMIASARMAHLARRAADYGVSAGPVEVDLAKVLERKSAVVKSFRASSQSKLEKEKNVDLIFGAARFSAPKQLIVEPSDPIGGASVGGALEIEADLIFINAGSRPSVPNLAGINEITYLNSTTIMEIAEIPEHLVIIGGGYVGIEFAQMFRRFGSRVTIIQRGSQLLSHEDDDIADAVLEILTEDGIDVILNGSARSARNVSGAIEINVAVDEDRRQAVQGSHLLLAAGRTPNSDTLDLDKAGIDTDRNGYIQVNEFLETSQSGVYALGDIKGGPAFTHISYDDYRIIKANLHATGKKRSCKDRIVPYTVFMDPQLGRVGLSEHDARKAGHNIQVAKQPMSHVARAIEVDETRGLMKVIVDADSKAILGCAILGIEGGEIMGALQIAMIGNVPYTRLRDTAFAHPTLIESLNNLFSSLD